MGLAGVVTIAAQDIAFLETLISARAPAGCARERRMGILLAAIDQDDDSKLFPGNQPDIRGRIRYAATVLKYGLPAAPVSRG
jgi:hypothetical protein